MQHNNYNNEDSLQANTNLPKESSTDIQTNIDPFTQQIDAYMLSVDQLDESVLNNNDDIVPENFVKAFEHPLPYRTAIINIMSSTPYLIQHGLDDHNTRLCDIHHFIQSLLGSNTIPTNDTLRVLNINLRSQWHVTYDEMVILKANSEEAKARFVHYYMTKQQYFTYLRDRFRLPLRQIHRIITVLYPDTLDDIFNRLWEIEHPTTRDYFLRPWLTSVEELGKLSEEKAAIEINHYDLSLIEVVQKSAIRFMSLQDIHRICVSNLIDNILMKFHFRELNHFDLYLQTRWSVSYKDLVDKPQRFKIQKLSYYMDSKHNTELCPRGASSSSGKVKIGSGEAVTFALDPSMTPEETFRKMTGSTPNKSNPQYPSAEPKKRNTHPAPIGSYISSIASSSIESQLSNIRNSPAQQIFKNMTGANPTVSNTFPIKRANKIIAANSNVDLSKKQKLVPEQTPNNSANVHQLFFDNGSKESIQVELTQEQLNEINRTIEISGIKPKG